MSTLRSSLLQVTILTGCLLSSGGYSSAAGLAINWPKLSTGADLFVDFGSREGALVGKYQLPFFEGDRELLDYHAPTELVAARTETQRLMLRSRGRDSEISLGTGNKIYGRAAFSPDGERLIAVGANAQDYAGVLDCYDTRSGELIWSRDVDLVANAILLREADRVLLTNYHNQHREGVVAVQLIRGGDGSVLSELVDVAYTSAIPIEGKVSQGARRLAYPTQQGILYVDTEADKLHWIGEASYGTSVISPEGRFLALCSRFPGTLDRIVDLSGELPAVGLGSFEGLDANFGRPEVFFSHDQRSIYLFSEAAGLEKWDFLEGKRLARFDFERIKTPFVIEVDGGERLFALGKTQEDRIRCAEFDTSSGRTLSERSWDLVSYSTLGSFGMTKVYSGYGMELSGDGQDLVVFVNSGTWKREIGAAAFVESEPETGPGYRVRALSHLAGKGVFRVVFGNGVVADYDESTLSGPDIVWSSPFVGMSDRVIIDPVDGDVGLRVLYDFMVLDSTSGELKYTLDNADDLGDVSGLRKGGSRLLVEVKDGSESDYGVYDLQAGNFLLKVSQIENYSGAATLSQSGEKLAVVIPYEYGDWRDGTLAVYDVASAQLLARADGYSTNKVFAFSEDEQRIVFATRNADKNEEIRWALVELNLGTGQTREALDLTKLGELAHPSEISFVGGSGVVIVRSGFYCLYLVDIELGTYSPIKYMRLGPIVGSEVTFREERIAASNSAYAMFDGRGRLEMGGVRRQNGFEQGFEIEADSFVPRGEPDPAADGYRFVWSSDGEVWFDDRSPVEEAAIRLEEISGKLVRLVQGTGKGNL